MEQLYDITVCHILQDMVRNIHIYKGYDINACYILHGILRNIRYKELVKSYISKVSNT